MNIIGIDPGTIKTGITHITGSTAKPKYVSEIIGYDCEQDKLPKIDERLLLIVPDILKRLDAAKPELVIYEYPFNIKGHARVNVELIGAIRWHCLNKGYKYIPLAQTRIKKYATGKGNCEKSDLRMQVYKEFGYDLSEDRADSFFIAHFGMGYLYPQVIDKQHRIDSIEAVKNGKPKKKKKEKERE